MQVGGKRPFPPKRLPYKIDAPVRTRENGANCVVTGNNMTNKTNLVTEIVGDEPYEYYPLGQYVVRAPGICGGRPTFKYTRIEIAYVLRRLANGETISDIVEGYRYRISKEAILEAIGIVAVDFHNNLTQMEPVYHDYSG